MGRRGDLDGTLRRTRFDRQHIALRLAPKGAVLPREYRLAEASCVGAKMNASFCLAIFHRVGRPRVRATTGDRRRPTLARAYPRLTATTVALATQLDVPEASLSDRTLAHAGVG